VQALDVKIIRHPLGWVGKTEADSTRYELLVTPFDTSLNLGYIATDRGYLVVDGFEKTAYVFRDIPSVGYVREKLVRSGSERDAENTQQLLKAIIEAIQ